MSKIADAIYQAGKERARQIIFENALEKGLSAEDAAEIAGITLVPCADKEMEESYDRKRNAARL